MPNRVTGRDALVAHMRNFPETFHVEFVDLVFHETLDPSRVIVEFGSTGTAVPTGKPVRAAVHLRRPHRRRGSAVTVAEIGCGNRHRRTLSGQHVRMSRRPVAPEEDRLGLLVHLGTLLCEATADLFADRDGTAAQGLWQRFVGWARARRPGQMVLALLSVARVGGNSMAALSIRDLDDVVREKLRIRAAQHGKSMESEIRDILTAAVAEDAPGTDLFSALADRFARLGGVELDLPARSTAPRPASLPE
ncbi:Arc family DNA-binding protein [Micromonospora sp. NPDC049240]|uniref:FitA-like ribbon-helix-helix domain-containing protein n=1 Tax=Micromonospora sp. NPDC049240 TaxID=3155151 RepID=UPI0033E1281C